MSAFVGKKLGDFKTLISISRRARTQGAALPRAVGAQGTTICPLPMAQLEPISSWSVTSVWIVSDSLFR